MRKKIVAGNWKMNKTFEEGTELVSEIIGLLEEDEHFQTKDYLFTILAPPFILLTDCQMLTIDNPKISVAAQNCYSEEKGAFTGEV